MSMPAASPSVPLSAQAAPPARRWRVQMIDDHHMMRVGLIALAGAAGRVPIDWVESANLGDALDAYAAGPPADLVLLDLNLPDSQGLQGLRRFMAAFPQARVAIFSATQDEFVIQQALAMGAIGFLPKSASAEGSLRLVESLLGADEALRAGARGAGHPGATTTAVGGAHTGLEQPLEREAMDRFLARQARELPSQLRLGAAALTATQIKVLELLLEGLTNQQIANECQLALGTVKNSVSCIFLAMNVKSRSHLMSVFR